MEEPLLDQDYFEHPFPGLLPEEDLPIGEHVEMGEHLLGVQKPPKVLLSADWRPILIEHEQQYGVYYDTSACTNFAALNQIELLTKLKYGMDVNYADAFNAKMSGTKPNIGNYVSKGFESIKRDGLVLEDRWAWDRGREIPYEQRFVDWFYREIPEDIKAEGKKWLDEWEFTAGWIEPTSNASRELLREGLQYAPVGISIATGVKPDKHGVYPRIDKPFNHRVTLLYVHDDGKLTILDHYSRIKVLAADYIVGWPSYITLNKKSMKNEYVKVLKHKGSSTVVFALPARNEQTFINFCDIYGIPYVLKEDGSLDWSSVAIDGEFTVDKGF